MASFFKIHEVDQLTTDARRKSRRRIAVITISSIVLVSVVIAAVVSTTAAVHKNNEQTTDSGLSSSIKSVCDVTLHPDLCYERLGSQAGDKTSPQELFFLSIRIALTELDQVSKNFKNKYTDRSNDTLTNGALANCVELLDMSFDHLNDSLSVPTTTLTQAFGDLRTWLSTAGTSQETCLDGFIDVDESLRSELTTLLKNSTELTSNSLAIVSWISSVADTVKFGQRRLLTNAEPEWVQRIDRKLVESVDLRRKADLVVAKDGSGKYKTINEALKAVKDKSTTVTVVYIKKGVYTEQVVVTKNKWNVVFVGDGMDVTIVSGSKNVVDGTPTFTTAPFIVIGKGFVARDIGFQNTAGPQKHQAVAVRSSGDFSVFYRCKFDAYQDTLYTHTNRQFYRECRIIGTVDFIFGNSASVFQNCNIQPRLPSPGQKNTVTAQGKADPNQNTGLSFQNCTITPFNALGKTETYLGRPWKAYSTTVFFHSFFGNLIHPNGWLPWVGNDAPSTIFYAEFQNSGPGASTKNRVKWKGLRTITAAIANKFTVNSFIGGSKWVSIAGVPVQGGL